MVHPSEPYPFHKQGAYMGAPVSKRGVDEEKRREEKGKKRIFLQGRLLISSILVDSNL